MEILKKFNIITENIELYNEAFTHNSYANENNVNSYERLEFLGDAVLDVIISKYLFTNTVYTEGEMTKLRASFVCENALFEYSKKIGLNSYLKLGNGELNSGGRDRKPTVADIFESFLGAVYLDQGLLKVEEIVYEIVIPFIKNEDNVFFKDYKSILQEYVQSDDSNVSYKLVNEEGPSHDKKFTVEVLVDDFVLGKGISKSKKEAEQLAAKDALNKKIWRN